MVNIRKAEVKDISRVYSLGKSVQEFAVNDETINFWPEDILRQATIAKDVLFLVAEVNQQVIGFIIANLNSSLRKALIENIYIMPEYRGNEIGDKLLRELLVSLDSIAIEYVSTLIPPNAHEATKLYINAGFSVGETFLWLDRSMTNTFKTG